MFIGECQVIRLWRLLGVAVILALLMPIGVGMIRSFLLMAIPIFWLSSLYLFRNRKWIFTVIGIIGIGIICLLSLPGREVDGKRLRNLYVSHLRGYEGAWYIFGGENRLGIDCSGLVRRALVDANLHLGLTTLDPTAIRQALYIWLHDASAKALGAGYLDLTTHVKTAKSIAELDVSEIKPGDLAVSQNGEHVLAYLGDNTLI